MMIPLCCYFLVYFFLGKINLWICQRPRKSESKSESENVCGGGDNNDRRDIYITLVALKEIDRRRRWEEEVKTCVYIQIIILHISTFYYCVCFFFSFFFSWHEFVFCVLCFVCVLWLERETETENATYIQERLKRRKYVMSNFLV